jgi:syntaxin 5
MYLFVAGGFDEAPFSLCFIVEIQELTQVIKQDIGRLNTQIKGLEKHLQENKGSTGHRQADEHSSSIVVSLQSKLANASNSFKEVLEIRTQVNGRWPF